MKKKHQVVRQPLHRTPVLGIVLLTAAVLIGPSVARAAPEQTDICHIPPGDPAGYRTFTVDEAARLGHLAHGDLVCSCGNAGHFLCYDGDQCTVDGFHPGTEICMVGKRVDCDDGDPATEDFCDSAVGCLNVDGGSPHGPFTLIVENGFGSGSYKAGEEVHVWADVDPSRALVTAWTGDVAGLKDPGEWHTTFEMPPHDAVLTPQIEPLDMRVTVVGMRGKNITKSVRYHIPREPRGLVLFAHGTNGWGEQFLEQIETAYVARVLVKAGYGVWWTDAEEVDVGDRHPFNGETQWRATIVQGSKDFDDIDFENISLLLRQFERRKLITAQTPRFALGFSNGGFFALALGAVGSRPDHADLSHAAVAVYCAPGGDTAAKITGTPSAWFLCPEDDPNNRARVNHRRVLNNEVPSELHTLVHSPLYDARFARIESIDAVRSAAIAQELRDNRHVDGSGLVVGNPEAIRGALRSSPCDYPVLASLRPRRLQGQVLDELRIMAGIHEMYDDFARRTLAFFEAHR